MSPEKHLAAILAAYDEDGWRYQLDGALYIAIENAEKDFDGVEETT